MEADRKNSQEKKAFDSAESNTTTFQTTEAKLYPSESRTSSYEKPPETEGFFKKLVNDFRPAPPTDRPDGVGLKRKLNNRHMQMISIGGAIGSGLYVGSGSSLADGGAASLVINYSLIGIMMFFTIYALGEMSVAYPIAGGFNTYAFRFIDPAWGFSLSWNYFINYFVTFPLELTTCAITFRFWSDINSAAWISIFLVAVIIINLLGVRAYGEVEFILSFIKVIATIGFIILAIIIDCGGVPTDHRGYIGGSIIRRNAFRHGFKGFCSVFVTAAFSFSGTEVIGLAAAETDDPKRTLPKSVRQIFWRIALFYSVSLLMIGLLISPEDSRLMGNQSGTSTSPFVLAIQEANIKGLPSVFNAVIIVSVISVTNTSTYTAGRTLHGMATLKHAPRVFLYTDRLGRPLFAMLVVLAFGFFAYINEANTKGNDISDTVFNWLLALTGLSNFFCWASICLSHIIFRIAFKKQGHTLDELAFVSPMGVWGSCIGFGFNILCLIAQFYVSLFPVGGKPNASDFFQGYLAAVVALIFFVGYKIYDRRCIPPLSQLDLNTGFHSAEFYNNYDEDHPRKERSKLAKVWSSCC
ncbi:plasma membrane arginine/lysine amino acid transmembrane transporter Cat1 [Schizosaccharomyces osmophilus]|uniref:Plasma membrane arginine/lysine amino acid transmembrane transporter Cat1 n=1 Tax=Schizosaccharomyces osmophilus TaxID=2545709 RepID=A0AAF0AVV1_9SCHI|nr:plasma membrane arginine/lysine amino acid transmembrane transporter Cat1 [Schizosaccharomyces osmophilus]WBW72872.1 plasma membrane arginine/lysine amino acid transmembrane transporter Cat1 [Schizosaccharomyces osmophilus]